MTVLVRDPDPDPRAPHPRHRELPRDRRPRPHRRAAPRGLLGREPRRDRRGPRPARSPAYRAAPRRSRAGRRANRTRIRPLGRPRPRALSSPTAPSPASRSERRARPLHASPSTHRRRDARDMGLEAGLSWDLGLEGHVEVLDVIDVVADIRDRSLPHVLRLPDTQLIITERGRGRNSGRHFPFPWLLSHPIRRGRPCPHRLGARALRRGHLATSSTQAKLTTDAHTTPADRAELANHAWNQQPPHPGLLRRHITETAQDAQERLVLVRPRPAAHPRVAAGNALRNQRTRRRDSAVPQPGRARPPTRPTSSSPSPRAPASREHSPSSPTKPTPCCTQTPPVA